MGKMEGNSIVVWGFIWLEIEVVVHTVVNVLSLSLSHSCG